LMLICPKCDGGTELRGTMDSWYLTWCPDCERLWRLDLRTLWDETDRATESSSSTRRTYGAIARAAEAPHTVFVQAAC